MSEGYVQGCDIAVEHDGDVYVSWRTVAAPAKKRVDGMAVVRSTDFGVTFNNPRQMASFTQYFPSQGPRDCGDGPFFCGAPGYVLPPGAARAAADGRPDRSC